MSRAGAFVGTCRFRCDSNGQVLVNLTDVRMGATKVDGGLPCCENGGQLMGLRSYFVVRQFQRQGRINLAVGQISRFFTRLQGVKL